MSDGQPEENARQKTEIPSRTDDVESLLAGLPDEHVWRLLRRFNKQVSHVQSISPQDDRLDLNRSEDELFPPQKLQRTIERFYTSVIAVFTGIIDHVTKLRSWDDPRRTGTFGAIYLGAWLCDMIIPVITITLVAMIVHPPLYRLLFPPVLKTKTSTAQPGTAVQKPDLPPRPPTGEEAENDAASIATSITNTTAEIPTSDELALTLSPTALIESPVTDETGQPPKTNPAIRRTMRILSNISDVFERGSNLLSPSPPFSLLAPRFQLITILSSVCIAAFLTSSYIIIKTLAFAIGVGFFGDPVFKRVIEFLDRTSPKWRECLDMEKTLLKGVPTNAQLTLTLLRIGEATHSPIPAPPGVHLSETKSSFQLWRQNRKAAKAAKAEALARSSSSSLSNATANSQDQVSEQLQKPKRWLRLLKFARRTITTAIKGHIAFDRAMTITASGYAKGLLSLLDTGNWTLAPPTRSGCLFEAKFEGKRGTVVLDSGIVPSSVGVAGEQGQGQEQEQALDAEGTATSTSTSAEAAMGSRVAVLYFVAKPPAKIENLRVDAQKKGSVVFQIPVGEIRELKKTEGLGWKGKLIVELAGGGGTENLSDGLVIRGVASGTETGSEREEEKAYHLTGMRARDQLFNRLVAGGGQAWEML
ncbi:hypothetical protein BJY04DRAFT_163855 [Aspergillus karnatakaensis]|uniref:uncharacterized protein n=1 Tax=Aspergillus karnatakaensis TaxID=1810916 RepID=UPI003CCD0CB3